MKKIFINAIFLASCLTLAGHLSAGQFTVDSNADPSAGDPGNCTGQPGNCTLRDALAAADLNPGMDTVVFDIDDAIYLNEKLTAYDSVTIDGGGDTLIRINQGYNIANLPCLVFLCPPTDPAQLLPTLQPVYFSNNENRRSMLDL